MTFDQGGDQTNPKEKQTACQIEIINLKTVLWVETTEQKPNIDHSNEKTEYIAMVSYQ